MALKAMNAIIGWLAAGNTPHAAQARGGRPSLPEPAFKCPTLSELGWEVELARHTDGPFGGGLDRSGMDSNGRTSRYW